MDLNCKGCEILLAAGRFILSKESRSTISNFIDKEFIKEAEKEIVLYIKNNQKISIDYEQYDENDIESRISIIEEGPFNIYEYIYTEELLEETSKEGSYAQTKKEENGEYKTVYMYKPKDIGTVIYEKVQRNLEHRKNEIYKEFKKQYYNEEFLFKSAKWYKRTRDGKEYFDLDLNEINPDKKRSFEERIKTEIGNTFKSRFGSMTDRKMLLLKGTLTLELYENGCINLNIENNYKVDVVKECGSIEEKNTIAVLTQNFRKAEMLYGKHSSLKMKAISTIDSRINKFLTIKVYKTENNMKLFLEEARRFVFGYYNSINGRKGSKNLKSKESEILKIIRRIALIENVLYSNYKRENSNAPSIEELQDFSECIPWMCYKGLIYAAENIYIKNKAKDKIREIILDNPIDEFKEARNIKRHFYLHVGETNTGKTYESIKRLMEVETGVYLAPLRLLALEVQDKLNSEGIPCSLLTGEEEDIIEYAGHVSSTVEKLQTGSYYDICVLDEAQMISDSQRGWAWTRAIIGVQSPEIHICMAPEALDVVVNLINDCNDTYEIKYHKRDTPLIFEDKIFNLENDIKPGDALVVFGKRKALAVSAELLNKNIKTSIIYGSLPYSTRKKQFERFLNGETQVLVCTDAIGMGVNLPIKRIVFLETRKYDGVSLRRLNVSEIKQIAGRAGRKGIYSKGYVASACDSTLIKNALKKKTEPIKKCVTAIPDSLLDIDTEMVDALKTWSLMPVKGYFEKTDVTRIIYLLNRLKKLKIDVSKRDALKMATIPFEENNKKVFALWEEYCSMYSKGAVNLRKPDFDKNVSSKKELDELESYYKSLDLNYSFAKNFNMVINNRFIASEKEKTANSINNLLLTKLLDHERVCSICKIKLSWDYPSDVCRKCRDKLDVEKKMKVKLKTKKPYRFYRKRRR